MILRPPRSKRTDTLFPYTTLFRSDDHIFGLPVSDRATEEGFEPVALVRFRMRKADCDRCDLDSRDPAEITEHRREHRVDRLINRRGPAGIEEDRERDLLAGLGERCRRRVRNEPAIESKAMQRAR